MNDNVFDVYGRLSCARADFPIAEDPFQDYAPTERFRTIQLPDLKVELRTQLARWKLLPNIFRPFFIHKWLDSSEECKARYSPHNDKLHKLGALIPIELDRSNVGWRWWTEEHRIKVQSIAQSTLINAARISPHTQDYPSEFKG